MSDHLKAIGILRFEAALPHDVSELATQDLYWPFGCPERLKNGTVLDMLDADHLVLMPRKWFWYRKLGKVSASVSLAIPEPRSYHRQHYILAKYLHRRFHKILTSDPALADNIPNASLIPFGTTWVSEWQSLDLKKDRNLSLIASKKHSLPGHKLRHRCVDWLRSEAIDSDVMGRGYLPFERKADGLAKYRFSVIIENCREENYFTEKLLDALLCRTVPIYWGCPNIGDYFDTRSMIICESFEDVCQAIGRLSDDVYRKHAQYFDKNEACAVHYADYYGRVAEVFLNADG